MKFLCVACDEPMTLVRAAPPDRGSIRAVYRCGACSREIAMLTNPFETQLVRSLGVAIGPQEPRAAAAPPPAAGLPGEGTAAAARAEAGDATAASKCPFSGMLAGMEGGAEAAGGFPWTAPALARLERMPDFVRPMARTGIETFARDRGYERVDETVLDEAKVFFGM